MIHFGTLYLITLSSDSTFQIWNVDKCSLVSTEQFDFQKIKIIAQKEKNLLVGYQGSKENSSFVVFDIQIKDSQFIFKKEAEKKSPHLFLKNLKEQKLKDFILVDGNVWALWISEGNYSITYGKLLLDSNEIPISPWVEIYTINKDLIFPIQDTTKITDEIEDFLHRKLFDINTFSLPVIQSVFSNLQKEELKEKIIYETDELIKSKCVEKEEYNQKYIEIWRKVWEECTKKWYLLNRPLSLGMITENDVCLISLVI